jgi:hypothetical protein
MNNRQSAVKSSYIPDRRCHITRWACHIMTRYSPTCIHIQYLNKQRSIPFKHALILMGFKLCYSERVVHSHYIGGSTAAKIHYL